MAGFVLRKTNTQLADWASLPFLYLPPEAAGGFVMSYFAYVASQKKSNKMYPRREGRIGG